MSIAKTLETILMDTRGSLGQKKSRAWAKMKKKVRERGIIFFTPSKGLESKKEVE